MIHATAHCQTCIVLSLKYISIVNTLAKLMCSVLGTSHSKPAPAPWASGDIYHSHTSLVHCRHLEDGCLRPQQLPLQTTLTREKVWCCKLSEARLPSPLSLVHCRYLEDGSLPLNNFPFKQLLHERRFGVANSQKHGFHLLPWHFLDAVLKSNNH